MQSYSNNEVRSPKENDEYQEHDMDLGCVGRNQGEIWAVGTGRSWLRKGYVCDTWQYEEYHL